MIRKKRKTKIVQVPMPEDLVESLDKLAYEMGESRSSVIREAAANYVTDTKEAADVRRYIESYENDPEDEEWGRVGEQLAAEVWGEEDWSEEYAAFVAERDAKR